MILVQMLATAAALMVSAVAAFPVQTQNSRPTATLCVPNDLLRYREIWDFPYPGGEIDVFKRAITGYIAAHGDPRVQYRIKAGAAEKFDPNTSTVSDVLEMVETQDACPAGTTRYLVELASLPARQEAPPPAAAPPQAASDVDRTCEALAGSTDSGLAGIEVARALPACQEAAQRVPIRAHFQFLFGRVLMAAKRNQDAAIAFAGGYTGGDAMSTYYLGFLNEAGLGVAQDYAEASRLYRLAGDEGVADAYARLGALDILDAQANAPNPAAQAATYRRAVQTLQLSADRGATSGLANLGWLYERGLGVTEDRARAVQYYLRAARAGDTVGSYRLALQYRSGAAGLERNTAEACRLFEAAAQHGYPYAQAELGNCYYSGQGKPEDHAAAFEWFQKAANAGLARAQEIVGELYDRGDGVAESPERAVEWFRKSAAENDPYGMFSLGAHLRMGRGVAWDEAAAMQLFEKAAALGDTGSMFSLGLGYLKGFGGLRQDYALAAHWFAEAAKYKPATNDQEVTLEFARMNLGDLYAKGWGVPQDIDKARALYALAAASPAEDLARMARALLDRVPSGSRAAESDASDFWSTLLPAVVIGGTAALALDWLFSGSSRGGDSSSSYSDYSLNWDTSYASKSYEEQANMRMMVGCFWDEATYLNYGGC